MALKLLTLVLAATSMVVDISFASPCTLPSKLLSLICEKPKGYYYEVKDIPQPVLSALSRITKAREFRIADRGGAWNKTDIVSDRGLPFRRLIWVAHVIGFYVLHYEMGGSGYSTHFLIVGSNEINEEWSVLWAASSFYTAKDYESFIAELKSCRLDTDPKNIH